MNQELSPNQSQNTTQKKDDTEKRRAYSKLASTQRSCKIIAFQELVKADQCKSERGISKLLQIPYSTIQTWQAQNALLKSSEDLVGIFFATPGGADLLQRIVAASMYNNKCGASGILGVQEFLRHSGLDRYVASSDGTLQAFWERCQECILVFGEQWEKKLSANMKKKNIAIATDEMFRHRKPCLVAIEVVANYILLEKFTENRKAETWKKELEQAILQKMPAVTIGQNVSDLCGALRSTTKSIGAIHSPDLFHGQYELSKATSAALASQERAAEAALQELQEELDKHLSKPTRIKEEEQTRNQEKEKELYKRKNVWHTIRDERKERKEKAQKAKKALGEIYHPINLDTGRIQSPKVMAKKVNDQFEIITEVADDARLGQSSHEKIEKAKRAFDLMKGYYRNFFLLFLASLLDMKLEIEERGFFKEVVFPLTYLNTIWRRLPKKEKQRYAALLVQLEKRFQEEGPWTAEFREALMRRGKELAEQFVRSSSCVEGRNGVLSLLLHRFHHIDEKTLRVLTTVHNFGVRRADESTAAMRFFGGEHDDLFEYLVKNVRIPGKPRSQNTQKVA